MRYCLAFAVFIMLLSQNLSAQYCTPPTSTTAITPTTTTQFTATFPAGTAPVFTFTATAGCTYTFATCGLSSVDTYLRIYNAAGALVQGWDDQCGFLQTNAVWLCNTSGPYSIQLSQFFCNPLYGPATVSYSTTCPTTSCTNPVVNAGNDLVLCAGSSVQLAGLASIGSGSGSTAPLTFSWTPAATLSANNVLNPIASPTTTTTYTLTATQGSCTSQDQVVVTVNPTPTISGTAQSFCPGSAVTLSATATPANGTFLWTPGGQTTNSITVSPTATTTYNVQYTLGACSSNTSVTATQINGIDWANTQWPGSSNICQGQSVTIYGQVFETGLTEATGQGAGITVQYGLSTTNTNPSTWPASAWTTASFNTLASGNPNNDEYMGTLSNLSPGTYYYAFSYTYNGCTTYGGYSTTGGGFWNGTSNVNGEIIVNANITPTFSPVAAICAGSTFPTLPTSSTNGINGTWSPAPNNLQTTTYTFTPNVGLCALPTTLTVAVNALPTLSIINAAGSTILNCTQTSISLNAVGAGSFAWANGVIPISTGSSINVTTPGTYTVGILDQNGCTTTTSLVITQNITAPVAVITNNTNTSVLTCSTTSISLTGAGGTTFAWSNGTSNFASTNTVSITNPGTYTLSTTGANGCIDTEIINITQNITPPVAGISSSVASNTLNCNTPSITLTASGGVSYSWANGSTILGTSNTINVTSAGTYTLTATGANGCTDTENITTTSQGNIIPTFNPIAPICAGGSFTLPTNSLNAVLGSWSPAPNFFSTTTYTFTPNAGLCANPITLTVVVNPYPVINAINDTICAGQTGTISTQVTVPGGAYTWTGTTNTAASLSLALNFSNSYQVIYTVAGCADTAFASIEVKPVPQVTVQNSTICVGQVGSVSASANLPNGTWQWSNGSTASSQALSPVATTNYNVVYTLNGCNSLPATATITVLPVPSITVNSPTICLGDPALLIATANPAGGNFYWGPTASAGNNQITVTPTQDTIIPIYNVLNGCFSDTIFSQITVNPLPISNISASINQGCVPISVVFTPDITTYDTYSWESNNQNIGTTNALAFDFISAGTYNITLTTTLNGCTSTATLTNPIIVDAYPIAAFEPSSDMFTEPGQGLSFWNNSSGAQTYLWDFGDGSTSTDFAPFHLFNNAENEEITVTLIAASNLGCTDTTEFLIEFDPGLVYYIPNSFTPDGDQYNQVFLPVFTYGIDPSNYSFEIYNRWGELIFESKNPAIGWDGTFGPDGIQCQNGSYIYKITIKVPSRDERKVFEGHVNLIR
jgi:gliding motility-associated-like protein